MCQQKLTFTNLKEHNCAQKFTDKKKFYLHQIQHKEVKKYKCDSCNAQFALKEMLDIHTQIHNFKKGAKNVIVCKLDKNHLFDGFLNSKKMVPCGQ